MNETQKKKLVLCRKAAYLRKCLKAQQLIATYETDTSVRRRVFDKYIQSELMCSYNSFHRMLREINPARQLADIEKEIDKL